MTIPTPQTPGPWHVLPDDAGGAWICTADATAIAYVEYLADAEFLLAAVALQHRQMTVALQQEEEQP